jgi:cleavage and polyadenylation specificity factor subunit 1
MSNAIRVLEPGTKDSVQICAFAHSNHFIDGTERQIIKDLDGSVPRPKIRHCSICDPFIMVIREDDSLGLFIGEPERGKIRRKDMSPMGDKVLPLLELLGSLPLTCRTLDLEVHCRMLLFRQDRDLQL